MNYFQSICPVCETEYAEIDKLCPVCGFGDLGKVFITEQDSAYWVETIVKPYRTHWEEKNLKPVICPGKREYSKNLESRGSFVVGLLTNTNEWEYYYYDYDHSARHYLDLYRKKKDGTEKQLLISKCSFSKLIGNWIFYTVDSSNGLFKMWLDGTGIQQLNDDECWKWSINTIGDWIYYMNRCESSRIYKINIDGAYRQILSNDKCHKLYVVGDWIYYEKKIDKWHNHIGKLYKMRTDGKKRKKLCDDKASIYNVKDDWIYYSNKSDGGESYRIRTDGKERQPFAFTPDYFF